MQKTNLQFEINTSTYQCADSQKRTKPSRIVGFLNKKLVEVDSAVGLDYEGDPAEGRTKISSLTFSK